MNVLRQVWGKEDCSAHLATHFFPHGALRSAARQTIQNTAVYLLRYVSSSVSHSTCQLFYFRHNERC